MTDVDVVIVGAGADGPVVADRLGRNGIEVVVLEAGPWHGNENWPRPHEEAGPATSSDPEDLSGELLDEQFTKRELEMTGKLRWGPADGGRNGWFRAGPGDGAALTVAGVGGTTLHYTGCHPRAYPMAIDDQGHWPIDYDDLVPYYRENERRLSVTPAPTTPKEALYYEGAAAAGWDLLRTKDVTEPGYRPQPNALVRPDEKLRNAEYDGPFTYPEVEGDTLAGVETAGNPHPIDAPFEEKAKQGTNLSYVPDALATGNVTIRPNAFVVDVLTEAPLGDQPVARGVRFRDTWSGTTETVTADAVVLAAGAVETPRLWLNSGLPANDDVGRGLTIHFGDAILGVFDAETLEERIGQPTLDPHKGQQIAARFDYPGLGGLQTFGGPPGTVSFSGYAASRSGFAFTNDTDGEPWDTRGRIVGPELKAKMAEYRRTISIQAMTDDHPNDSNRVEVIPGVTDEHGPVPRLVYEPTDETLRRRNALMEIAAGILNAAGAQHVHRLDAPPAAIHIHSTMRIGTVLDEACEAKDVARLFVADHSALANSVGGPNPTNTGQALAMRTADKMRERYFSA